MIYYIVYFNLALVNKRTSTIVQDTVQAYTIRVSKEVYENKFLLDNEIKNKSSENYSSLIAQKRLNNSNLDARLRLMETKLETPTLQIQLVSAKVDNGLI